MTTTDPATAHPLIFLIDKAREVASEAERRKQAITQVQPERGLGIMPYLVALAAIGMDVGVLREHVGEDGPVSTERVNQIRRPVKIVEDAGDAPAWYRHAKAELSVAKAMGNFDEVAAKVADDVFAAVQDVL